VKAMVIGLGRVGWAYSKEEGRGLAASHFGAYYLHKDIDTVIAVDSDEKRLAECSQWFKLSRALARAGKEVVFASNYVEPLNQLRPEIVSVCVPTPFHGEVMLRLCEDYVPNVICLEKPVAPSIEEAERIKGRVDATYAKTRRPKVAVNFTLRWDEGWRKVKPWLDRIKPIVAYGYHPGPLLRTGIHMLDMFNYLFGDPVRVIGESGEGFPTWMTRKMPGTDDYGGWGIVEYRDGIRAYLVGGELAKEDPYVLFELEIYGKDGAILVRHNGNDMVLEIARESKHYSGLRELQHEISEHPETTTNIQRMAMVDDLVQCVKDPDRQPASDLTSAIKAQALVHLIRSSHLRWLGLQDVDFRDAIKSH
jgi:predicted dehydrogenase